MNDIKFTLSGVNISLSDRIVRVDNDEKLKALLRSGRHRSALHLSAQILKSYEEYFGKPLKIPVKSLAAEIYDHYLIQEITLRAERIVGKIRPTRWMIHHMQVIDCGERAVDNNRFLWNLASVFWRSGKSD